MLCILEKISPSELVSNSYISNHNKMRRPHPKFKVSFYLHFCCFWINVTQINFENIKRKIQRIISDSCFQVKLWFHGDARAPSTPLLNFPFKIYFDLFIVRTSSAASCRISPSWTSARTSSHLCPTTLVSWWRYSTWICSATDWPRYRSASVTWEVCAGWTWRRTSWTRSWIRSWETAWMISSARLVHKG